MTHIPPWSPDYVRAEPDPSSLPWLASTPAPDIVTPVVRSSDSWADQFQRAATEAAKEALQKAAPAIQQQLAQYTQNYVNGVLTGKPVAFPTITTTTSTGQSLTIASARNRSWRTFLQGLGLDILFALMTLVGTLGNVDFFSAAGWTIVGALFVKTIIQTVISYVARLKITPPYDPV